MSSFAEPPSPSSPVGPAPAVRAAFFGSGAFAVPILESLAAVPGVRIVGIVTSPPGTAGRRGVVRPSLVAARAADLGVGPILTPERLRDPAAIADVQALAPGLIVLADYGRLVPPAILDLPRHGALNLHPSLLPRYRGATPIPAAILAGDRETGVTLMVMDAGLDTGPIVAQVAVPLGGSEVAPELEARLAIEAAVLLASVLPVWLAGTRPARPQPAWDEPATRPLRKDDGRLLPERGAVFLERQVRAYQPWPGSFVETDAGRLVVWRARALAIDAVGDGRAAEGTLVPDGDGMALVVRDGALRLDEVQLPGGRRMSADALRRGHPGLVGTRLLEGSRR